MSRGDGGMGAFVGRQAEVAEITARLGRVRLVTLSGSGGVGKTRLGLEIAGKAAPGTAAIVDVAAVDGPDAPAPAVTGALGGPDVSLLVLDTCEALIDQAAALVSELLAAARGAWSVLGGTCARRPWR
ncbi:hypothetical protein AB0J63_44480 [Streptosporangium canum]|uniref:hypothetical protein n=1 Tax=Streptosporangium canum TaxID=324952 RepID=UPI00342CFD83